MTSSRGVSAKQTYDLAFRTNEIIGVERFRIVIASSLDPITETGWQAIYSLIP